MINYLLLFILPFKQTRYATVSNSKSLITYFFFLTWLVNSNLFNFKTSIWDGSQRLQFFYQQWTKLKRKSSLKFWLIIINHQIHKVKNALIVIVIVEELNTTCLKFSTSIYFKKYLLSLKGFSMKEPNLINSLSYWQTLLIPPQWLLAIIFHFFCWMVFISLFFLLWFLNIKPITFYNTFSIFWKNYWFCELWTIWKYIFL